MGALITTSYPMVNGRRLSWARIKLSIDKNGGEVFGFTAISYKQSVSRSAVRGHGRQILGFTDGEYMVDNVSLTFREEEWRNLIGKLGDGYMDAVVTISVSYDFNGVTHTDVISGASMKEDPHDLKQGTDAPEVVVPFDALTCKVSSLNPINGFTA